MSLYEIYGAIIHYRKISDKNEVKASPPSDEFDERYAAMLQTVASLGDPTVKVH